MIKLYFADLKEGDWVEQQGYRVTTLVQIQDSCPMIFLHRQYRKDAGRGCLPVNRSTNFLRTIPGCS